MTELSNTPHHVTESLYTLLKSRKGNGKQGRENSLNKDKTNYQHLEFRSSQTQLSRLQYKNKINNSQDNMPALVSSSPNIVDTENCNIDEA